MQLITCFEWVDAGPHGEGVWLTGGVGPMWRDHQLPRDKAASDRARSICHAVLGATIGAQTKRAKLNFLQEPSVWSMQQGGKKMVTEKKVGGPSVVVVVRSCCSSSAANIMTLTNFIQGVSKKTSFCQSWPWQILLLIMRNPLSFFMTNAGDSFCNSYIIHLLSGWVGLHKSDISKVICVFGHLSVDK